MAFSSGLVRRARRSLAGPRFRPVVDVLESRTALSPILFTNNNIPANSLSAFVVQPNGDLTAVAGSPFATGGAAGNSATDSGSVAVDQRTARLYATNDATNSISGFDIQPDGSLVPLPGGPVSSGGVLPIGVAIDPRGRFLYVANDLSGTIQVFTIQGDGTLLPIGGAVAPGVAVLAVHPSGNFLYGVSDQNSSVFGFAVSASGALTPVPGSPYNATNTSDGLGVTPDGRFLYVQSFAPVQASPPLVVVGFSIDPVTGALTALPTSPYPGSSSFIALNPAGTLLFTVSDADPNATQVYSRAANGSLTPVAGSPFPNNPGTTNLGGYVASPDGLHLYAADCMSPQVSAFDIGPAGALTNHPGGPYGTGADPSFLQGIAVFNDTADLSVTKTGPATATSGSTLTYTVTVANNGPTAAFNVSLTDALPAEVSFLSAAQTGGPAFTLSTPAVGDTGAVIATGPRFRVGETASFSIVVQITHAGTNATVLTNTAIVASTSTDPNPANDTASTTTAVSGTGIVATGIIATGTDLYGAPEVKVFDAATGALKFDFLAYAPNFFGGVRVAVGDVNGDGTPDIITVPGVGGGPLVKVFSGKDLSLILSFNAYDTGLRTGLYVAVGDVSKDGFADIITAPDRGGGPLVNVFDGKTTAKLLSFNAYDPAFLGGVRVAAGDTNGDGFADIITGPGFGGGPLVCVFDGRTGAGLLSYNAYAASFVGGIFVGAGDVDGDGKADVITAPGVGGGPLVNVFSGPTGTIIRSFNAYPPVATPLPIFGSDGVWQSGLHVAALDVTSDGKADLVTGVGPSQRQEVRVFDAVSLALLDDFFAYDPSYLGGVFVGG